MGDILNLLKKKGFKITRGRKLIIEILVCQNSPISPILLINLLHNKKVFLNKTTVYRELEFLIKQNIVKEIHFAERNKRYEISTDHHHHLVCKKCKKVEIITSDDLEHELASLEKNIFKIKQFQDVYHSLEFFGFCEKCQ